MFDLLKKGILTGVGIGLLTKEKIEEYAKKAAKEAKLSETEERKLLKDLLQQSEEIKNELQKKIETEVNTVIKKSGVATQQELKEIEKRLAKVEKLLGEKTDKST